MDTSADGGGDDRLQDAKDLIQAMMKREIPLTNEVAYACLNAANGFEYDKELLRQLGSDIINRNGAVARQKIGQRPTGEDKRWVNERFGGF